MELKTLGTKVKGLTDGGEDRGVSPVIGVILMVAITVILAAVIGAFVLGLGSDLESSAAPTATVGASGTVEHANSGTAFSSADIVLEHTQGDDLVTEELRFIVRAEDGTNLGAVDGENLDFSTVNEDFVVGDTIKLDSHVTDAPNNGVESVLTGDVSAHSELTIEIVHSPSGTQIGSGIVTVQEAAA